MIDRTNKQKGNCGLGIAIGYFSTNGYTVSIPLNDTQDYDLLIDKENKIQSVQVKYTTCKTKYGNYQVALKSCGGTKGTTYKTVIDTKVQLKVLLGDGELYLYRNFKLEEKVLIGESKEMFMYICENI